MTTVRFSEHETQLDLPPVEVIFGRTTEMQVIRRKLEMVAKTNVAVLVQGESGTGKELIARLIHGTSERVAGELVNAISGHVSQKMREFYSHQRTKVRYEAAQAIEPDYDIKKLMAEGRRQVRQERRKVNRPLKANEALNRHFANEAWPICAVAVWLAERIENHNVVQLRARDSKLRIFRPLWHSGVILPKRRS